jgi:NADH-quinone oxidoreductase subunit L
MFHHMTHAFFKALLFLGAGAVIHSLSGEQDMRRMGGMRRMMPGTFGVMLVATLAIAGVPGLAGFFSKDEILWRAFGFVQGPGFSGHPVLWALGALAAGLTAFYMFRLMFMVFWGQPRMPDDVRRHAHEAPRVMLVPLLVLAVLAAVGGYVGVPAALGGANRLEAYLAPSFAHLEHVAPGGHAETAVHHGEALTLEYSLMAVSVAMALAGILLAWLFYIKRPDLPGRLTRAVPRVYTFVAEKFYVDELYGATVVGGFFLMTRLSNWFDRWIVDGLVNLTRHVTVGSAHVSYFFDLYVVDLLVNATGWITRGLFHLFRRFQTGLVQTYAAGMVFGLFVLVSLYLLIFAGN